MKSGTFTRNGQPKGSPWLLKLVAKECKAGEVAVATDRFGNTRGQFTLVAKVATVTDAYSGKAFDLFEIEPVTITA